jgi:precorrin-6B methylase 2
MGCTTASVSYRESLTKDELVQALLSGKVPQNRRPHLRTLFDEGSPGVILGLLEQVGNSAKPGKKVVANARRIAKELHVLPRVQDWLKSI